LSMNKPNFQAMTRKELHAYVLKHREDVEAFHIYVDKLHKEANWIEMAPLESLDDLNNYPEFIETLHKYNESA